jgi:hypothetical protein
MDLFLKFAGASLSSEILAERRILKLMNLLNFQA